jgi:hypothetical protein
MRRTYYHQPEERLSVLFADIVLYVHSHIYGNVSCARARAAAFVALLIALVDKHF